VRIVPVIDLKAGQVVHAVAGRRAEYRPVHSVLAPDARPQSIARAFRGLGFSKAYVADLDAIAGSEPAWGVYDVIADSGLELLVDAGVADEQRARQLAEFRLADGRELAGVIVGLESIASPVALAACLAAIGTQRLIFSLDLRDGRPVACSSEWKHLPAEQIAAAVVNAGVRRMIVLDVASVGTGEGCGTHELCQHLRDAYPQLELIAGGGVSDRNDLDSLAQAGCDAVLIASALHGGTLP